MTNHTKSIPSKTAAFIRTHITKGEEPFDHPYLDNKGYVTAAVGLKIDTEDAFKKLPWKTGNRPATDTEMSTAWQQMQQAHSANKGQHNWKANKYENTTGITLDETDIPGLTDAAIAPR